MEGAFERQRGALAILQGWALYKTAARKWLLETIAT